MYTMYEAIFRHRFANKLVLYILLLLLLLISPFIFIWELILHVRSCFKSTENMAGKVVLITGASSGLGELIAYEYAKRGARLAIIAREKLESRLKKVAERARQLGSPDVLFMYADVSKVDDCRKFVDGTIQRFGQLDHLVCNAGIGSTYSTNTNITKFEPVMDINFWGSIYPTHFAIPYLKSSHGKIIVNASSAGLFHPPNGGFYNASKAALISFYESLRYEVFPSVTITILTLGFIQTNFITAKNLANSAGLNLRKDIGAIVPAMGAEACAKAIVDGVCKGASSIMEPRFIKAMALIKFFFPQLHRFYLNIYSRKIFLRLKGTD